MNLEGKGIYIFTDPAGQNSVLALVDNLIFAGKIPKKDFLVYTNHKGKIANGYEDIVTPEIFDKYTIAKIILDFVPEYLFLGTSSENHEHSWRKIGDQYGIKIISFIDHWTNYLERFSNNNEVIFGDEIWLVNDEAKIEAITAGIPKNKIHISGNPYYQKVNSFKPKFIKESFCNDLGLDIRKKMILFVSDDIKRNFPYDSKGDCVLGFDEYTVLGELLDSLNLVGIRLNNFQLVIKLHPRAKIDKFKDLLNNTPKILDTIVVKDCDSLTLNYFSDFVIGMFSNMIIEAYLLGKRLMRLQVGQKNRDLMKFRPLRDEVVLTKKDLDKKLGRFLEIE